MSEPFIATRRYFLRNGLNILSAAATVPTFLDRTAVAFAAEPDEKRGGQARLYGNDHRVLVVLQLAGGNDGLNTIIPVRNDLYYRARPQIGIARREALALSDDLALHPAAEGLKKLYDAGLLAIVQGVGYPNPDRSHFRSTDIWETADPQQATHRGWLGRFVDCTCSGRDRPDPKLAIALTREAPLALLGERFSPVAFEQPGQLTWSPGSVSSAARDAFDRLNRPDDGHNPDGTLRPATAIEYLQRTALDARMSAHEIQDAAAGAGRRRRDRRLPGGGGRSQLSAQLRMVARMIAAGLPTRIYYVSLGGFDTHAAQPQRHQQLMREMGDGLAQFFDDLRESRQINRVLLMTFSEFGRRVAQNASQGTDHGAAAPMFLAGAAVRPGIHGTHPSLEKLDNGDLKWQIDFRAVYGAILGQWLGADPRKVLGRRFANIQLIRKR